MTTENIKGKLDRILDGLKSGEREREIAAINELETINVSSEAIVLRLEQLALGTLDEMLRKVALGALSLKTSQFVKSKLSPYGKPARKMFLLEIVHWQELGFIEEVQAEVIKRQYDFDLHPGIPMRQPDVLTDERPAPVIDKKSIQPFETTAAEIPLPTPKPAESRPSLPQILLSETSIRVYLYLGAFFVIASAAILAALVEAARLPVLFVATLIFAGGAISLKNRLSQPSFALAVVFSFLLPIDAVVVADTINLPTRGSDFYWAGIFLFMVGIWGLGTWFYESRMFSLVSFAAFILAILRLDNAFVLSNEWTVFTIGAAGLVTLVFIHKLENWRGKKFSTPLLIAAQILQIVVLLISLSFISLELLISGTSPNIWIARTITWLCAALFFAASNLFTPFAFFPWMTVASLFLIPWLILSSFDESAPVQIAGFVAWGAFSALTSEFTNRSQRRSLLPYSLPLLALSLSQFSVAIIWGLVEDVIYAFTAFLTTGLVYTIVHSMRTRWYVWTTALLAWLGCYFAFFGLPFMRNLDIDLIYQLLIPGIVLLLPELFAKEPLTFSRSWNWPPIALGTLLVAGNILFTHVVLLENNTLFSRAAVSLGVYAFLFAAYALRIKLPLLGYFATASLALTASYTLAHFELDPWLPSLTALSGIYYFSGYFLHKKNPGEAWGMMLINSGLALGGIISLIAMFVLKPFGGWYVLIVSGFFAIEMFKSRKSYLETITVALVNVSLIISLNDINVIEPAYYLFGSSLIWLSADTVFKLSYQGRKWHDLTRLIGGLAVVATMITIILAEGLASAPASACFAVYTIFFAAYASIHKRPVLGYLSTASATATMFFAIEHFRIEMWLPIFTGLAIAYYATGFMGHKKSPDWGKMLRYSGLALGGMVSLVAMIRFESAGGWYAFLIGVLLVVETVSQQKGWFEAGIHIIFSISAFLILRDFNINEYSYILLALTLVWLGGDLFLHKTSRNRKIALAARTIGSSLALLNAISLLFSPFVEAAICFGIYTLFFAIYSLMYKQPLVGYASTVSLPLSIICGLSATGRNEWLIPAIAISVGYYTAGFALRQMEKSNWGEIFLFSGMGLGVLTAILAPFQSGGMEKAIPIAIAATFFAVEAYSKRNVWLAFPANIFYLVSYFTLLVELNVEQPQYFSIGAALIGLLMHFLLSLAGSKTGAFITGTISQLVLLGTSYIQLVSTSQVGYFFVLFFQSLVIIFYGLYMRSRSLVFAPIVIVVLATLTILYSALRNLSLVIIIGVSGIVLLTLGILAVLMKEKITSFVERFNTWNA